MERYAPFALHLKFFLRCKIAIKGSNAVFMHK